MNKLNIVLLIILISLSAAVAFADEAATEFEPNKMTEAQLDAELDELIDIKAIEDAKNNPQEQAE